MSQRLRLFLLILTALIPFAAFPSATWNYHCRGVRILAPAMTGPDFVSGVDFASLAERLRADTESPFDGSHPVPFTLTNGKTYSMRIGKAREGGKSLVLKLFEGNREVSTLLFEPERPGGSPHINYVETDRDYGKRRANEALLRTMMAIYPESRAFEARLAWVNFKVTAETLTGKEQPNELGAELAIEDALRAGKQREVAKAIESSPTGNAMKALGFDVEPFTLVLLKPVRDNDPLGPMLQVRWVKK